MSAAATPYSEQWSFSLSRWRSSPPIAGRTGTRTRRASLPPRSRARLNPDLVGWGIVNSADESATPGACCGSGVEDYFAERSSILDEVFNGYEPQRLSQRRNALALLGTFRATPRRIIDRLWNVALAGDESERPLAQKLLAREEGYFAQVLAALTDPRPEARANAADWLTCIGGAQAIESLRAAVGKSAARSYATHSSSRSSASAPISTISSTAMR
jgi:hypothetical protein